MVLPVGLCALAGFMRTGRRSSASTGAVLGLATMIVSIAGCQQTFEHLPSIEVVYLQAVGSAALGAAFTFWVCGFWEIR